MTTRDMATLVLLQEVVLRRLAEQKADTRTAALDVFDQVGVRDIGVIGDEQIGSVQLTKGRSSAVVTDMSELLQWAVQHHPTEVVDVPMLRPAFLKALLDAAKRDGAAVTKDGEPIPGIDVRTAEPSLMVKPSEDATDTLARAFAEGRLTLADLAAPIAIDR